MPERWLASAIAYGKKGMQHNSNCVRSSVRTQSCSKAPASPCEVSSARRMKFALSRQTGSECVAIFPPVRHNRSCPSRRPNASSALMPVGGGGLPKVEQIDGSGASHCSRTTCNSPRHFADGRLVSRF